MRFPAVKQERSAVLFMEDGAVSRQMLYSEFEAILDHVVGMNEFSNREVRAVYIQLDHSLRIVAAAFFLLKFDQHGLADSDWNTPLELLISRASTGPDLGAGPIRLVCRNRCPIAWHQAELWDPSLSDNSNAFNRLREAVRENRLALPRLDIPEVSTDQPPCSDDIPILCDEEPVAHVRGFRQTRDRTSRRLKNLRLRLSLLKSEHEDRLSRLCGRHRDELQHSGQQLLELESRLAEEQGVNQHLKGLMNRQADDIGALRVQLSGQADQIDQGEEATQRLDQDYDFKLDLATAELQESLERKDMALRERNTRLEQLAAEIEDLQLQKRTLQEQAVGGDFLRRLSSVGINYVACQPGAGEFRVPDEDIVAYLESPIDYAAKFCNVDVEHYRAWLKHHEKPRCCQIAQGGQVCGLPVHRVEAPATFVLGESDRCSQHRASSLTLSRVMNRAS